MTATARAQHGQFDKARRQPGRRSATSSRRRASSSEGQAGRGQRARRAARLNVTIVDAATGKPTLCRVNVVGADGNYYQPQDNPLAAYSLTGTWPDTLAGNRPEQGADPLLRPLLLHRRRRSASTCRRARCGSKSGKVSNIGPRCSRTDIAAGASARSEDVDRAARADGRAGLVLGRPAPALHSRQRRRRQHDLRSARSRGHPLRHDPVLQRNTTPIRGMMPELVTPQLRGLGAEVDPPARRLSDHFRPGISQRRAAAT